MNNLKKFEKFLTFFEEYSIAMLLFMMTVVTFWGVVNRFVFKHSLPWSEELARYLSIWAALIGASLGVKKNIHIGVEAFVAFLPSKVQRHFAVITCTISMLFCLSMVYVGGVYSVKLIKTWQLSAAMRIPIFIAYSAIPVGCAMMAFRFLVILLEEIPRLKSTSLDCQKET